MTSKVTKLHEEEQDDISPASVPDNKSEDKVKDTLTDLDIVINSDGKVSRIFHFQDKIVAVENFKKNIKEQKNNSPDTRDNTIKSSPFNVSIGENNTNGITSNEQIEGQTNYDTLDEPIIETIVNYICKNKEKRFAKN